MTSVSFPRVAALLALLSLAACDDSSTRAAAPAPDPLLAQAQQAAQGKLGSELRGALRFEAVRVFPQAAAGTVAVCGQVALTGAAQPVPFVSLVSRQPDGALAVEQHVATESVSATRVYVETQARCVADAAGAAAPRRGAPPPLPAIPANLATLAPAAPAAVLAQEAAQAQIQAQAGASGQVTMRQAGNLRQNPNGGGAVLRVLPRGASLRVFAEAPGGWLQIGTQEAEGWMHASMVSRGPEASLITASR